MIVTFTANPCIDVTLDVPSFSLDEVNRARSRHKDPAGKGINVSRALAKNNVATVAVFPSDSLTGAWIVEALDQENIETMAIDIHDDVRTNITIVDDAGNTTRVTEPGPTITTDERDALLASVASALSTRPAWLVVAGSLTSGLDADFLLEIARLARERGVRVAVDSSGDALSAVAHAGVADLMKPNHEELEQLAGRSLTTVGAVVDFARSLVRDAEAVVVVSLGVHGALAVSRDHSLWAGHDPVVVDSTVGAGDCTVAGYLSADLECRRTEIGGVEGLTMRLTTAVAWGAAAVQLPATTMPGPGDITRDRVRVTHNLAEETRIEDL